jgi:hypothetical protein
MSCILKAAGKNSDKIKKVYFPGPWTGEGNIKFDETTNEMANAYSK